MFAAKFGIDGEPIKTSKGRRDLKYIIIKVLEGKLDEEGKTDEEKCDIFKHIIEDLKFYNGNHETTQADQKENGKKNATGADSNADNDGQGNNFSPILRELNLRTSLLSKELKIKGQIGEANQKDKLTYVSLMHPIDEAQEAGYEESEIVSSVIRTMIPSLILRNLLERTPNLSLNHLLQYSEAHFGERNATDLCSKLTSMVQLPEESEFQYVMRCIEIRQKVILASNKSDINYDKELVRKLFYRTLERGLLSSYVIQEIKSLIRNNASDEDLIAAVTKASATEKERNLVQGKHQNKKALRVYEISSTCNRSGQVEMDNKVDNSGSGKVDKFLSVVDALTKQVNSLKSVLREIKNEKRGDKYYSESKYLCRDCFNKNKNYCNHCYKCGSSSHVARGCNAPPSSGN